jgi:methionyl-tRNA synthetase
MEQNPGSIPTTQGSQSATPQVASGKPTIEYGDFDKIELKVATIVEVRPHPNADKLLVLQIDVGNGERRQICAGIKQHYTPEQLTGKQIVVVANLAPRPLRGEVSQGMLLAATDAASGKVVVLSPSEGVASGSGVK